MKYRKYYLQKIEIKEWFWKFSMESLDEITLYQNMIYKVANIIYKKVLMFVVGVWKSDRKEQVMKIYEKEKFLTS
jgi:hypothetical protein